MWLDPDPTEFPADWAVAWGEDHYGLWQAFEIQGVRQLMRWIRPGDFMMGSPDEEPQRDDDETLHRVILTKGYWLAETACTQALWQAVMQENPAHFKADELLPVEQVSWLDCQEFLQEMNTIAAFAETALTLRLPTEAEWEYACRAGSTTVFNVGNSLDSTQANFDSSSLYDNGEKGEYRKRTLAVHAQEFLPNDWGLYQMHGNVWEWCEDVKQAYPQTEVIDPLNSGDVSGEDGQQRVLRGGSWIAHARRLRSAYRYARRPGDRNRSIGLRLAGG